MAYETRRPPKAVILAAGTGSRLSPQKDASHKCLLSVGGSVILERLIRNCLSCGISQFVIVLGHRGDQVRAFVDKTFRGIRVSYITNDRYRDTDTGYSLMLASPAIGAAEFVKFDADMVFDVKILRQLLDSDSTSILCIDRNHESGNDEKKVIVDDDMRLLEIGRGVSRAVATGESIGIEKIGARDAVQLFRTLAQIVEDAAPRRDYYEAAYQQLVVKGVPFETLDITGLNWTGIDTAEDLAAAVAQFASPVTTISRSQQKAADEAAGKAEPISW